MVAAALERLRFLCDTIPPLLSQISADEFAAKPQPAKWSKKEIIGHLIDSAANNHHRFVRGQFEEAPFIKYNQDEWNAHSRYHEMDSAQVIAFWEAYNRFLLALAARIPSEKLLREVNTGGEKNLSIAFLIHDYVQHLEHHLRQVLDY